MNTSSSILVVEDEQLVALDIQRRLTQLGYRVVGIADRATTALEAVAQFHPDLVLMDIRIKGDVDGIATAQQIHAQYSLPVIFLTAHADEATVAQAKGTQPFGYLLKPVQTKHLSTAIEIALSRHQAEVMMQNALEKERDLTEALQRALDKERQLNELKSQFVSIVSHEFRNPLSSLVFTLELLYRQDSQLTPEKRLAHIQRAKAATTNLTQLIEDILTFSEAESIQFQCQPSPMNVPWFCRELIEEFQPRIAAHHTIIFTTQGCEDNATVFYNLDVKLLRHILVNLISNAIKYSPDGGEIQFRLFCKPEEVTFQVHDQGIGIPVEDQIFLFEPFHRGTNARKLPGTGLGLSIAKKCIDIHKGTITVASAIGAGTTFVVKIPQQPLDSI